MHTSFEPTVRVRPEIDRMATYVPGESLEAFSARTGIAVNQLIKLNANESPYDPSPAVIRALGNYKNYNNYPDTSAAALRAALSAYTGVDPRFIMLSHGSMELINLLWHIFLSPGDTIICCPPTYSFYTFLTSFCGAYVLEVQRTVDYEVDVDGILATLTPDTKLIVLCSPNNPTGNPITEADVLALLDTGRIVVVDEAYVEFSHSPRGLAHLVPRYRNLVVLRTFSKWAGLAGLRIGYGLFPEWIVSYMLRAQCPFEVNIAGHIAAIATLADLPYVQANVRRITEERERLFQVMCMQSYLHPIPSQGNFILAQVCEEEVKVEDVRSTVESYGVLLRYFSHPYQRNFLRVTVGLPEHTAVLAEAFGKVRKA
jgi:histidinol-phosphate aminotransferase